MAGENGGTGASPLSSTPAFVNPYTQIVTDTAAAVASGQQVASSIAGPAPLSTSQTIAQRIAAAPAAPTGYHYGKILDANGQPILYYDFSNPNNPSTKQQTPVQPAGSTAAGSAATSAQAAATAATMAQNTLAQATAAQAKQNAIAFLTATFTDYGLGSDIASAITNLVQQGYTADTIQMMAQDPKSKDPLAVAFQARFPANAARLSAGLPVLSPGEYIATERSYAQVLQAYGLPASFATNKDIFTKLLTNDVSPTELNSRASTAKQVITNSDPLVTQQLQAYYGLSQGDMIAHVLDPSVATPIIEKQISAAQMGGEAARYGANINQSYAEQMTQLGITQAQANQGFQNIATQQDSMQALASRYTAYGPAGEVGGALQAATFGTTGAIQAQEELNRLKTQEVSQFSGSSGAGKGSLMGTEAGTN